MYKVSETVLPIYINGQCPIIKTCSDVTLNLSSKDSTYSVNSACSITQCELKGALISSNTECICTVN